MYVIYALIDPRDYTVHYVGQTTDAYRRFSDHINGNGGNFIKTGWIAELRTLNKMVIMETLEEVEDQEHALKREAYWIKHFRALSEPLANATHRATIKKARTIRMSASLHLAQDSSLDGAFIPGPRDGLVPTEKHDDLAYFYGKERDVKKALRSIGVGNACFRHASFILESRGLKQARRA